MGRHLIFVLACLGVVMPAAADEMPTRKAGLWEITMAIEGMGHAMPTVHQCTDASTDKAMMTNFDASGMAKCSERRISNAGGIITIDSTCEIAGAKVTSRAVVTGSFDKEYVMKVTSKREGGSTMRRAGMGDETHITMKAKWVGACAKDQRPGDIIMPGGIKINVSEIRLQHGSRPAH